MERKDKIIVGVNDYVMDEKPFSILYIDESVADAQTARVQRLKTTRDNMRVQKCLADLQEAARGTDNVMYPMLDCRARLRDARRDVRCPARRLG